MRQNQQEPVALPARSDCKHRRLHKSARLRNPQPIPSTTAGSSALASTPDLEAYILLPPVCLRAVSRLRSILLILAIGCSSGTEPPPSNSIGRVVVAPDPFTQDGLVINDTGQLKVYVLDTADVLLPDAPTEWSTSAGPVSRFGHVSRPAPCVPRPAHHPRSWVAHQVRMWSSSRPAATATSEVTLSSRLKR